MGGRRAGRGFFLLLLLIGPAVAGCFQVRYLTQAAAGEYDLFARAKPIVTVLREHRAPLRTRQILSRVREIKAFGRANGLTPADNYETYSDLQRDAVVWVVQAAPRLSLEPMKWTFPLVGSVPYLGYFDEDRANALAETLAADDSFDVSVRPTTAFSTLGWLPDPVLNTMIRDTPDALGEFANVLLHESVHATVYVPDQSAFNESLASFVADRLTLQWLQRAFGEDDPVTVVWARSQAAYLRRVARMHEAWVFLDALYRRTDLTDAQKLAQKAEYLTALWDELGARRIINNATLADYKTYDTGAAAFEQLLFACGSDWTRFLNAIRSLRRHDFAQPQAEQFDDVILKLARSL